MNSERSIEPSLRLRVLRHAIPAAAVLGAASAWFRGHDSALAWAGYWAGLSLQAALVAGVVGLLTAVYSSRRAVLAGVVALWLTVAVLVLGLRNDLADAAEAASARQISAKQTPAVEPGFEAWLAAKPPEYRARCKMRVQYGGLLDCLDDYRNGR